MHQQQLGQQAHLFFHIVQPDEQASLQTEDTENGNELQMKEEIKFWQLWSVVRDLQEKHKSIKLNFGANNTNKKPKYKEEISNSNVKNIV